jgi:predicted metal-dependent HD superfamily phosphohydrolase
VADLNLHVDGPHSPERTKEIADLLAECVRFLNHATMSGNGLDDPADVYYVLGALYTGTQRLPQLTRQITAVLTAQAATGTLGNNRDSDPAVEVTEAGYDLLDASVAAETLTTALQTAQQGIAGLYVKGEIPGA